MFWLVLSVFVVVLVIVVAVDFVDVAVDFVDFVDLDDDVLPGIPHSSQREDAPSCSYVQ